MDLIIAAVILGGAIIAAAERLTRVKPPAEHHQVHIVIEQPPPLIRVDPPSDKPTLSTPSHPPHHVQGRMGFGMFSPPDTYMRP